MQKVKSVSTESNVQVGDTSLQLVTSIPLFLPKIREFTFVRYRVSPGLDIRLASVQESNDRDLVKDQPGFSAWYSSQRVQSSDTKQLLNQLLAHNGRAEQKGRFTLQRDEILSGCLEERATSLGPGEVLGICSLCKTINGRSWHLPMLDFNIAPSRDATSCANLRRSNFARFAPHFFRISRSELQIFSSFLLEKVISIRITKIIHVIG